MFAAHRTPEGKAAFDKWFEKNAVKHELVTVRVETATMLDRGGPLAGVVLWEFRPVGGGSRTGLRLLLGPRVEIIAE